MNSSELSRVERLLAYALLFEAPRYDPKTGERLALDDASDAAAEALRFYAAALLGWEPTPEFM